MFFTACPFRGTIPRQLGVRDGIGGSFLTPMGSRLVATVPFPTGVEAIERVKPHLYVKGQDYRDGGIERTGAIAEEERAVERHGGRLVFTNEMEFSSTKPLNEFFRVPEDNPQITQMNTDKRRRIGGSGSTSAYICVVCE